MPVDVSIDASDIQRQLGPFADQLAFATALTLTRVAEEYVTQERRDLPQHFTIRTTWVAKGFRVKRATKQELVATAFHKDAYMGLQETGGTKTPSPGKRTMAIPITGGARKTPQSTTPRSKWPNRLAGSFVITSKGGDKFIAIRQGKRGRRKKRATAFSFATDKRQAGQKDPRVRVMYLLKPRAHLDKQWGFTDRASAFLAKRFTPNLHGFLAAAIRTRR